MKSATEFPHRLVVRANDLRADGLAVRICFEMDCKNNFSHLLFLGPSGTAEISRDELLASFDSERSFAVMDYVDPRMGFTGRVNATVLTDEELRRALDAYRLYRKYTSYPKDYEANLIAALERGQTPNEFHLEIEVG